MIEEILYLEGEQVRAPISLIQRWTLLNHLKNHGWDVNEAIEELNKKLSKYRANVK